MNRREFFRRLTGRPSIDAEEALSIIDRASDYNLGVLEDITAEELAQYIGKDLAKRQKVVNAIYNKLTNKYWNVDNPGEYSVGLKPHIRHLKTNFMNEFIQSLDDTGRKALEENPEKVGEVVGNFVDNLLNRFKQ